MAKKTWSQLRDIIEQILEDETNATFDTTALDIFMRRGLEEISQYVPYIEKETATTTADSRVLDISSITDLIFIDRLEYPVDEDPREFHNWDEREEGSIEIDTCRTPDADESVYLFCAKLQRLTETDDLVGAIDNAPSGYAAGVATIHVDTLGTGTIYKNTKFTITGDTTTYRVTSDVTLATNECDLAISPVLAAAVADNVVVTLETSTLNPTLERIFCDLVAGRAAINYPRAQFNATNVGGVNAPDRLKAWGREKVSEALFQLQPLTFVRDNKSYPQ